MDTEWCCGWGFPLEPKLSLGVQTCQGTRRLFSGGTDQLPETEQILHQEGA